MVASAEESRQEETPMSKLNIRSVLLITGAIIGFARTGHADESFCDSQLKLLHTYLGIIPVVGYVMVTLKLGEQPCFFGAGLIKLESDVAPDANTIFEMASVTRVFTTEILPLRVLGLRGVNPDAPVKPPPDYNLSSNEENVALQKLATFTGGFDWNDPPGFDHKGTSAPIWSRKQFVYAVHDLKPTKGDSPGATYLPTYNKYSNGSIVSSARSCFTWTTRNHIPSIRTALASRAGSRKT
jgi:Beta-lactamase